MERRGSGEKAGEEMQEGIAGHAPTFPCLPPPLIKVQLGLLLRAEQVSIKYTTARYLAFDQ